MKICLAAGGRFHIFDTARELQKRGFLFRFITVYPKFKTREFGIKDTSIVSLLFFGIAHRIWLKLGGKFLIRLIHNGFSKVSSRLIPPSCDIFWGLSSFCLEGILKAKKRGIITIVDHGSSHLAFVNKTLSSEAERLGVKNIEMAEEWIVEKEEAEFQNADFILVGSTFAKQTFMEQGYKERKVFVNNYGVDISNFKPGIKNDTVFRIIFTGIIGLRKGTGYLIKAFNELHLENTELWLIGKKSQEFETISNKMGLKYDNVVFKGVYPQSELASLYTQGSVFCLPSIEDGFGMVVPQAMACGLPVIVSENTGAKDVVIDGENGFIVPVSNIEALKEKIYYLYQNEQERVSMGIKATKVANADLSWSSYGNKLEEILTHIAKARNE